MFSFLRKSLDWLRFPVNRDMATETSVVKVHPDTTKPNIAWDKLKVKQKVEKVQPIDPTTPITSDKIRFVCISDTHTKIEIHPDKIPQGDVILHAGDITEVGHARQVKTFDTFLGNLPHPVKIVIAGNHDLTFDDNLVHNRREYLRRNFRVHEAQLEDVLNEYGVSSVKELLTNCVYLEDEAVDVCGINVYGSPWQPEFCDWGFNLARGEQCLEKWNWIPDNTDILITHGPPIGHGDKCFDDLRAGCVELLQTIQKRVKPKFHIFGHIHEDKTIYITMKITITPENEEVKIHFTQTGYGVTTDGHTQFINASTCTLRYRPSNPPVVFDYPIPEEHSKEELLTIKPVRLIRNSR